MPATISADSGQETRSGSNSTSGASRRTVFTRHQLSELETRFREQTFLSKEERAQLADELGLAERQIMIWFQNRRGRLKRRGPSDTAYSAEKLKELNTRRPYPFLYGLLSSIQYRYPEAHHHPYQHLLAGSSPPKHMTSANTCSDVTRKTYVTTIGTHSTHGSYITPVSTHVTSHDSNGVPLQKESSRDSPLPTSNTSVNATSANMPPNMTAKNGPVMPPNVTVHQMSKSYQGIPYGSGNIRSVENDFRWTMGSMPQSYGWLPSRAEPTRHQRQHPPPFNHHIPPTHPYHNYKSGQNYNWTIPQTATGYYHNYPFGHHPDPQNAHLYTPGYDPNQNEAAPAPPYNHSQTQSYLSQAPMPSPPQAYLSQSLTPYTPNSPDSPYAQHNFADATPPPNLTPLLPSFSHPSSQGYLSHRPSVYTTGSIGTPHPRHSGPDSMAPSCNTSPYSASQVSPSLSAGSRSVGPESPHCGLSPGAFGCASSTHPDLAVQTAPRMGDPDSTSMISTGSCESLSAVSPAVSYNSAPGGVSTKPLWGGGMGVGVGGVGDAACALQSHGQTAVCMGDPDSTSMLSGGSPPDISPPGYNFNPNLKEFNCVPDFPDICSSSIYRSQTC